jgi:hypothetical protein
MIHRGIPFFDGKILSEQKDTHMFPPVPMVYEHVPSEPLSWEYRVLSFDLRESGLPSADELNELGEKGWLLVSALNPDQRFVHYYFVRQKQA